MAKAQIIYECPEKRTGFLQINSSASSMKLKLDKLPGPK